MEILNHFAKILGDLGVFGFIVWGVQNVINNSSERKFADYKSNIDLKLLEYKSQYDAQIEKHKSELKFLNDRLLSLHSERLKIIKELNDKLVKLNSNMVRIVSPRLIFDTDKEKIKESEQKLLIEAQESYNDYNNFVLFNKIYFTKSFADKLVKIKNEYFEAQWDFFEPQRMQNMGVTQVDAYKEVRNKALAASKKITQQIPLLIAEVEDDFRELLSVKE